MTKTIKTLANAVCSLRAFVSSYQPKPCFKQAWPSLCLLPIDCLRLHSTGKKKPRYAKTFQPFGNKLINQILPIMSGKLFFMFLLLRWLNPLGDWRCGWRLTLWARSQGEACRHTVGDAVSIRAKGFFWFLSESTSCLARTRAPRAPGAFQKNAVTFHNPSVQRHFRRFAPSLSRHFPSQKPPLTPISAGFHLSEWHIQLSHFREQLSCRKTVSVWAKTLSAFQKTVTVLLWLSLSQMSLRLPRITEEWKQMKAKWNVRAQRTPLRTPLFTGVPAHSVKREGICLHTCFKIAPSIIYTFSRSSCIIVPKIL